jgi:hypothetical protein
VFFSDEKTFQLGATPTHAWQEHTDRVIKEYVKHAPKLHVWGAIGYYGRTELYCFQENLNSKGYQRILKQNLKESKLIYSSDAPKTLPIGYFCRITQRHTKPKKPWNCSMN